MPRVPPLRHSSEWKCQQLRYSDHQFRCSLDAAEGLLRLKRPINFMDHVIGCSKLPLSTPLRRHPPGSALCNQWKNLKLLIFPLKFYNATHKEKIRILWAAVAEICRCKVYRGRDMQQYPRVFIVQNKFYGNLPLLVQL